MKPIGHSRFRDPPRQLAAHNRLLGLGLVLALGVLVFAAVSNPLHCWLHADAQESDHHCAVELIAGGLVDVASVATIPTMPIPCRVASISLLLTVPDARAWRQPPARGPPTRLDLLNPTPG